LPADQASFDTAAMQEAAMTRSGQRNDPDEFFEILVTAFGQRGGALPGDAELCWRPATDVYETADGLVVQMDLAGMEPARIEVACDERSLLIRGVRAESAEPGPKHFHTMEINVGPFERRVTLPAGLDPATATAAYRAGFLYVTFRKGEPHQGHRRQIAVDR
jgi:HSP20 family protein